MSADRQPGMDYDGTMRKQQEHLKAWIAAGLKKPGKSVGGLAAYLGFANNSPVSKMLRDRRIQEYEIPKIAAYLEEVPPEPPEIVATFSKSEQLMFLVGRIAAGIWRDQRMLPCAQATNIPRYRGKPYLLKKQEAYQVEDDSADLFARSGECVIVVDYADISSAPSEDDYAVLQLSQPMGAAVLAEFTIRKLERSDDGLVLRGLCSRPGTVDDIPYEPAGGRMALRLIIGVVRYLNYRK